MEKTLLPRMSGWLVVVVALLIAVWLIAPHQLPVSLYKLSLVTLAAVVGYWLDRSLFPYARPHEFFDEDEFEEHDETEPETALGVSVLSVCTNMAGWCMIRRAIIVAAAMIAVSLGA